MSMHHNVADDFNHIQQNVFKFRWHFSISQHVSMDDTEGRFTFRSYLFDLRSKTRKPSSHDNNSVHIYIDTEWPFQFSWYVNIQRLEWFCICGIGWQQKCTRHILVHNFLKIYHTTQSIIVLLSTLVDSSAWTAQHSGPVLSSNCASISSAISSIHLVMVLPERGTHAIFWTAASP